MKVSANGVPIAESALPWVTVITPSLNQGNFIERTILSVLEQDYPKLEYIVVDGGSTDGTAEILRTYQHRLSKLIVEPDSGQANALNKGLSHASGELIGWQNADDVYLPGAVRTMATTLMARRGAALAFGNVVVIDENDRVLRRVPKMPVSVECLALDVAHVPNQAALWRRDAMLGEVFNEELNYVFDWEWFLRLVSKGREVAFIPQYLGAFRVHAASKTAGEAGRSWRGWAREEEEVIKRHVGAYSRGARTRCLVKRLLFHLRSREFSFVGEQLRRAIRRRRRFGV